MSVVDELKRRNVFRAGGAYVVLGWLVVQVTETVSPALNLPDWTIAFVIWVGIIGLPFVLFFAWAYEITPDGIKKESEVDRSQSITHVTAKKLNLALLALIALAVAMLAWDLISSTVDPDKSANNVAVDQSSNGADSLAPNSIAVLPLHNMSAIPDNEYFVGGIHEEILTNLSTIDDLRVVSRTTALRYVNSDLSVSDIGRELQVHYIVEGSVRRVDNHVRITVQLIDATDDAHLWARNYDRELVDVFATQSEVAREITNSIQLEILPETVGSLDDMPTRSVRAYDLYTKAVGIDRSEPSSEESYRRQRDLLEAAVAEDPDFVEAWAHLNVVLDEIARTISQQDWFGETEAERDANLAEAREAALRALNRAVALDPNNVATLQALATDFVAEQEDADYRVNRRKYLDQALELDPDNAYSWYLLGWWHFLVADPHEARQPFLKALELDPLHGHMVGGALYYFRNIGDQEMTTLLSERLVQIAPEYGENEALTKVTSYSRLNGILSQFRVTADESLIDTYALAIAEETENFVGDISLQDSLVWYEVHVLELQNDVDRLANFSFNPLSENPAHNEINQYVLANRIVLAAQQVTDRPDDAAATARRILDAVETFEFDVSSEFIPVIAAYAALGDREKILEMRRSEDGESIGTDEMSPWPYLALAYLDPDRAAELLLAHAAKHPQWFGADLIAMDHLTARHLLVHPDVRNFYMNNGKWADYLAARVPEYAQ